MVRGRACRFEAGMVWEGEKMLHSPQSMAAYAIFFACLR